MSGKCTCKECVPKGKQSTSRRNGFVNPLVVAALVGAAIDPMVKRVTGGKAPVEHGIAEALKLAETLGDVTGVSPMVRKVKGMVCPGCRKSVSAVGKRRNKPFPPLPGKKRK